MRKMKEHLIEYYEKMRRKELIREIEILRDLVLEVIGDEKLLEKIIKLEHARTQYYELPESWVIDDEDDKDEKIAVKELIDLLHEPPLTHKKKRWYPFKKIINFFRRLKDDLGVLSTIGEWDNEK